MKPPCPTCGDDNYPGPGISRSGVRYCSTQCAGKAERERVLEAISFGASVGLLSHYDLVLDGENGKFTPVAEDMLDAIEAAGFVLASRDGLSDAVAHLAAATSAYEKYAGNSERRSVRDALFKTRLSDFQRATEAAQQMYRAALAMLSPPPSPHRPEMAGNCDKSSEEMAAEHQPAAALATLGKGGS